MKSLTKQKKCLKNTNKENIQEKKIETTMTKYKNVEKNPRKTMKQENDKNPK